MDFNKFSRKIIPLKGEIDHFTPESVILRDNREFPFDKVIFCTGYKPDMSFLPEDVQISLNKSDLYLNMFLANSSKIAFIGMHSANRLSILAQQAEFASHILSCKGKLPSYCEMQNSILSMPSLAPVDYVNTLAKQAGSFPDINQFKHANPKLYSILKTCSFLPSQNKLTGPYKNSEPATKIIQDADEYRQTIPSLTRVKLGSNSNEVSTVNSSNRNSSDEKNDNSNLQTEEEKNVKISSLPQTMYSSNNMEIIQQIPKPEAGNTVPNSSKSLFANSNALLGNNSQAVQLQKQLLAQQSAQKLLSHKKAISAIK